MRQGPLDTVLLSMQVRATEPPDLCPGTLASVVAPVIACLHNLEDAFTGHAGAAIRAAGVELASSACATASRCPTSTRSTACSRSAASSRCATSTPTRC